VVAKARQVMSEMIPIASDAPVMKAWEVYKATDDYANTKRWALESEHTDGSLWAAFLQGWACCSLMLAATQAADAVDPHATDSGKAVHAR
jgi:hypothetical protein